MNWRPTHTDDTSGADRANEDDAGLGKRPQHDTVAKLALRRLLSVNLWQVNSIILALIAVAVLVSLGSSTHLEAPKTLLARYAAEGAAFAGFTIDRITVTGRGQADADDIATAIDARRGAPILAFDTAAAKARLERLGWVDSARVSRLLPDQISVSIDERAPYALWQNKGEVEIVDKEGVVLEGLRLRDHLHLPLVVGTGAGVAARGLIDRLSPYRAIVERLRAMVRVADRRWTLTLDGDLDVLLPEEGIDAALARLDAIDRQIQVFSRDLVAVDLRLPDRVTFREPGETDAKATAPLASAPAKESRSGG